MGSMRSSVGIEVNFGGDVDLDLEEISESDPDKITEEKTILVKRFESSDNSLMK